MWGGVGRGGWSAAEQQGRGSEAGPCTQQAVHSPALLEVCAAPLTGSGCARSGCRCGRCPPRAAARARPAACPGCSSSRCAPARVGQRRAVDCAAGQQLHHSATPSHTQMRQPLHLQHANKAALGSTRHAPAGWRARWTRPCQHGTQQRKNDNNKGRLACRMACTMDRFWMITATCSGVLPGTKKSSPMYASPSAAAAGWREVGAVRRDGAAASGKLQPAALRQTTTSSATHNACPRDPKSPDKSGCPAHPT